MKKFLITLSTILVLLTGFYIAMTQNQLNYSAPENWVISQTDSQNAVDVFFIGPTTYDEPEGTLNMSMDNEKAKRGFKAEINQDIQLFNENTRVFVPYYRQGNLAKFTFPLDVISILKGYKDIRNAFSYYLKNINNGRPFILAGYSQGAINGSFLMKEFMKDEYLQDKLIAAYLIGWRFEDWELKMFPQMQMAQGETDTGVIVSWNSEKEGTEETLFVEKNQRTHSINPLNWKTDSTKAPASMNKGAAFFDTKGNKTDEIKNLTGAYIDEKRGTLIVDHENLRQFTEGMHVFGDGVYHCYDLWFYFNNVKENVKTRINSYLKKHPYTN